MNDTRTLTHLITHKSAIEKYCTIMNTVHTVNVSTNKEFQHCFNGFYRVRRGQEWQKSYYELFEEYKRVEDLSFAKILLALYERTGRIEASFSSKLLATIKPDMPIWDSIVLKNLGKKKPTMNGRKEKRIKQTILLYDELVKFYQNYLLTEEAKYYIKEFDDTFPEYTEMTSLKKMDFLIWGSRPLNRKEKRRLLKQLIRENDEYILYHFHKVLEEIDAIKINYVSYSSTHPVDVTEELKRLSNVDYESCCAIATMLIRENYFIYGALEQRVANGDVKRVLMRMIELI